MGHFMVGHRSKEYSELHGEVVSKLKKLLFTENEVYLGTHSSTGWMEAAIRNCGHKRILACVNGAFSKRWFQLAAPNKVEADKYEVEWGKGHDPKEIDKLLSTGKYDCFLVVHNETSTGVMNKLEEISDVLKKYPDVIFCVDSVSSMTGVKIEVDKLGLDVCLAGVQKAFALPPGLAVAAVSKKALEKSAKAENKGYYFDFVEFQKYQEKNQTPSTPAISHIFALNKQLDKFFAEGLDNRFSRHQEMADYIRNWAKKNFALFPEPGYESVTLTCINNTKGISVADLNKKLAEKDMTLSNGYGDLKEKTFRIAHMGDLTMKDMKELITAVDEILGL
ncbi:alanine--glyoxylate aminotransferase family protein [candidate division WOR-3 bacterium]|nr:alanine--glyoxylate aminotransferase family protein [candidate division WOR-3 bacterium]